MSIVSKIILPKKTIGIIGGNHISRFLSLSAKKMGFNIAILDPSEQCSASSVADTHIIRRYNDEVGLLELSLKSDILTYEFETIDSQVLRYLSSETHLSQGTLGLEITQDRMLEREFLNDHMINISPYTSAVLISDIKEAGSNLGYPLVVKSVRRSVLSDLSIIIRSEGDINQAVPLIQQGACLVEPLLKIEKELFISVGINKEGDYTLFPIVETKHGSDGKLKEVYAAYDMLSEDLENQITIIAKVIASELSVTGVVGIALFLTNEGNLYVNEISTRPQDAGCFALDSCNFSEYDVHVRGLTNQPLPEICQFIPSISIMITHENIELVLLIMKKKKNWHYYFYYEQISTDFMGQLGHITILSENFAETKQELRYLGLIN